MDNQVNYERLWKLQNTISDICLIDYFPFGKRAKEFIEEIEEEFDHEIFFSDPKDKHDLQEIRERVCSKETPNIEGIKNVSIRSARQLGLGITCLLQGAVDVDTLCKDLSPTREGCRKKERRIEKYERNLQAYFQELGEGIIAEEDTRRHKFPTLWTYNFFNGETFPFSSPSKGKMSTKERNERVSEFLSTFKHQINSQEHTDLDVLGWHPEKPNNYSYFGKPNQNIQFIIAPSHKSGKTPIGFSDYRYLILQIEGEVKNFSVFGEFSRENVLFAMARLFYPQCWGLWRYQQLKRKKPNILSDKLKNVDIPSLKDEYFTRISHENDFRKYALNVKTDIDALHTLMNKTKRLPNETPFGSSSHKKQYFSDEILSTGQKILRKVRKHLDIGEKVFQRNIEGINNLFSAKVAHTNIRRQWITIGLAVIAIFISIIGIFLRFL